MLAELLVQWFPMVMLIGVWVYFMRRNGGGIGAQGYRERSERHMDRVESILERIADALEKRTSNPN